MKKLIYTISFAVCFVTKVSAQSSINDMSPTKDDETSLPIWVHKINAEVLMGNWDFITDINMSIKANVGYKPNDRISLGIGTKLFYNSYSGSRTSKVDYGGFMYSRCKIYKGFYVQAEYHITKFIDKSQYEIWLTGATVDYPSLGAGYSIGKGLWTIQTQIQYIPNEVVGYHNSRLEAWAGVGYRF